jgi:hypothetical protein
LGLPNSIPNHAMPCQVRTCFQEWLFFVPSCLVLACMHQTALTMVILKPVPLSWRAEPWRHVKAAVMVCSQHTQHLLIAACHCGLITQVCHNAHGLEVEHLQQTAGTCRHNRLPLTLTLPPWSQQHSQLLGVAWLVVLGRCCLVWARQPQWGATVGAPSDLTRVGGPCN